MAQPLMFMMTMKSKNTEECVTGGEEAFQYQLCNELCKQSYLVSLGS